MELAVTTVVFLLVLQLVSGHGHGHGGHKHASRRPRPPPNKAGIHDKRVVQDAEHIKEHYEGKLAFNESAMSPEELEFHYFKLHDFDNNTMLDGLEIFKALTHLMPYDDLDLGSGNVDPKGKTTDQVKEEKKKLKMKYYADIVDSVMKEDDVDDDGYLTYAEYVLARRRAEKKGEKDSDESDSDETDSGETDGHETKSRRH
ncbi:hypothetical protein NP493_1658g00002 [Ridgeia piscesae]|uniref:EF-hand domain-containing protein n=1 Tax=Ridgeia piscesae TaxID=27915 RepID=A0AAD9JWS3_RIDPI|nr:hypothetical protein NP493_1658g00002 [Ridgeia piscesae]